MVQKKKVVKRSVAAPRKKTRAVAVSRSGSKKKAAVKAKSRTGSLKPVKKKPAKRAVAAPRKKTAAASRSSSKKKAVVKTKPLKSAKKKPAKRTVAAPRKKTAAALRSGSKKKAAVKAKPRTGSLKSAKKKPAKRVVAAPRKKTRAVAASRSGSKKKAVEKTKPLKSAKKKPAKRTVAAPRKKTAAASRSGSKKKAAVKTKPRTASLPKKDKMNNSMQKPQLLRTGSRSASPVKNWKRKKDMSDLFFQLLQELLGKISEPITEKSNRHQLPCITLQADKPTTDADEASSLDDLDLGLNLDDMPLVNKERKQSIDSDLPALSDFWPGKTAQYWIPSDDNQNGKHLALDLTSALLGGMEIAPSSTVPLLFYHPGSEVGPSVLCFKDPLHPFIRHCEKSIENELYNKSLETYRILLIPTYNIPKKQLLVITPPVSNMGVLEKECDICWTFEHFPNDQERCVFFEDGNTPNTLRQSQVLTEIAQGGRLYIVMCANELLASSNIRTDINSPQKAIKKMFEKQLSVLCPGTWNRLLCDENLKNGFSALFKELFNPVKESGIYHLKMFKLVSHANIKVIPFSAELKRTVTAELKNIYLEYLPGLVKTLKDNIFINKDELDNFIISSVTRACHDLYSREKGAFPKNEKTRNALLASLFYLEFNCAKKIADNFICELMKLENKLLEFSTYDAGKHYLWNYFPVFENLCAKELAALQNKVLTVQNAFFEITAKESEDDQNVE